MSARWEISFFSEDLGTDATLLLTFETLVGVEQKQQQICWKVTKFAAKGPYNITVVYQDSLVYIKPVLVGKNIVSAATYVPIDVSQQTTLLEYNKVFSFTPPIPITSKDMQALNGTQEKQAMALGFLKKGAFIPDFLLYYPEIQPTQSVGLKFTPVLRAYITNDYKQSDVITGDVEGDSIWVQDLTNLESSTAWKLHYDENTGQITAVQYFGNRE